MDRASTSTVQSSLPTTAFVRVQVVFRRFPIGRSTLWRKGVRDDRFPQPSSLDGGRQPSTPRTSGRRFPRWSRPLSGSRSPASGKPGPGISGQASKFQRREPQSAEE
jgi:hypothetical protein